jgi:uncharacterized protein (TIGR02145 family)
MPMVMAALHPTGEVGFVGSAELPQPDNIAANPTNTEIRINIRNLPLLESTQPSGLRNASARADVASNVRSGLRPVEHSMTPIRVRAAAIALTVAFGSVGGASSTQPAKDQNASTVSASKRMADGKEWTTANLNVNTSPSYCYDDAEPNCRRYGRLYTWASAQRACQSLGGGWRLPTDVEWRLMAKRYGGVSSDSADEGKAAFKALMSGGGSGFNAVLGGGSFAGKYERVEAHGLYWTASDNDPASAPVYNFGQNGGALHRQPGGDKQRAFSVRCIRG